MLPWKSVQVLCILIWSSIESVFGKALHPDIGYQTIRWTFLYIVGLCFISLCMGKKEQEINIVLGLKCSTTKKHFEGWKPVACVCIHIPPAHRKKLLSNLLSLFIITAAVWRTVNLCRTFQAVLCGLKQLIVSTGLVCLSLAGCWKSCRFLTCCATQATPLLRWDEWRLAAAPFLARPNVSCNPLWLTWLGTRTARRPAWTVAWRPLVSEDSVWSAARMSHAHV